MPSGHSGTSEGGPGGVNTVRDHQGLTLRSKRIIFNFDVGDLKDPWRVQGSQGPSGIDNIVKRNHLSQKIKPWWPRWPQGPLEGPRGPRTIRDWLWVHEEPFKPKKFNLNILKAARGSWGAGHRPGPSGNDTEVKRNRLSQKRISPQPAFDGLKVAGGAWGPDTVRDHQGLTLGRKEPFEPKKNSSLTGLRQPLEASVGRNLGRNLGRHTDFWNGLDLRLHLVWYPVFGLNEAAHVLHPYVRGF